MRDTLDLAVLFIWRAIRKRKLTYSNGNKPFLDPYAFLVTPLLPVQIKHMLDGVVQRQSWRGGNALFQSMICVKKREKQMWALVSATNLAGIDDFTRTTMVPSSRRNCMSVCKTTCREFWHIWAELTRQLTKRTCEPQLLRKHHLFGSPRFQTLVILEKPVWRRVC